MIVLLKKILDKNVFQIMRSLDRKSRYYFSWIKKISPDIIYEFYPFDYEPQYQDKILDADMILNTADMKLETILSLLDTFKNKDYFPYITGFLSEHSIFVINFDLATDKDYLLSLILN